ncbi:MAG TPA: class I SAM-dependent methyltransferase [Pyrinomonadaceae bacterium]|nr:class I SAM-dependent methyltransferase [Pyrinomonadaceae bacterium]
MKPKTVADPVGEFYTNHPYPPPLENLDRVRDMWQDENVHRAEFHLLWPHKEYRADFNVLIAGCGTWQAAKFALCHPAARVVGIDISPTSLKHTEALKQKYDVSNLETRQLPIENAADLDQRFDLVISTGVLHHLVDPDAGLRALRSVLNEDGAMYLMLYAPYARTGVHMLQDYCRRLGVGTSPEEINDLTKVLSLLSQHHPLVLMMRGSRDGLDGNALVDAVLNPRDRTYSVPQLFEFIERNEMSFARWYWQAPYLPQCGAIAETPHASRLAALPEREQYTQMELWRGLIANHDFIVQRGEAKKISFDDQQHLRYVPIRRTWTMCVQDALPPGAAGVLLNRTHLFDDLFLPVNDLEKQMYEAIDGRRSISEIVEAVQYSSPHARDFFEKLWRYDQVVFDISRG